MKRSDGNEKVGSLKLAGRKAAAFLKKDAVLTIAWLLAIVSVFFVRPDREYLHYIDYRTLLLLWVLMLLVAGLRNAGIFERLGEILLKHISTLRGLESILVFLCFFSSMFITNDVALITFVPFGIAVMKMAGRQNRILMTVILQTVAANLGSMLLPMGNPQNLYLYGRSAMSMTDFVRLIFPYSAVCFVLLAVILFFRSGEALPEMKRGDVSASRRGAVLYGVLFLAVLGIVAKVLPLMITVPVLLVLLIWDRSIFRQADYSLLAIFTGFFLFVGNMQRIPAIQSALAGLMESSPMATAILTSQVISNVPAALLLSGFTKNCELLILGTNLGGLGTLIASMASLISYRFAMQEQPEARKKYIGIFTGINLLFLAAELLAYLILA